MLQSISSTRGIAQHIANTYWPIVCSKLFPACVALVADFDSGEILIGEHTFGNGVQLFWTVLSEEPGLRRVMLELSVDGAGVGSVSDFVLDDVGMIDAKRSDPTATLMQHPTTTKMQDNLKILDTIKQIISTSPSTFLIQGATYKLSDVDIAKG